MRIVVHCTACLRNQQHTEPEHSDPSFASFIADYDNNFVVRGLCPQNHKYIGYMTKERYDALYESAVLSFLMGFELEAVLGLAASLERAQELFTMVSLRSTGLEVVAIENMWKQVGRQSERQLGAFLSQWLITTGQEFVLDNKMTSFRNKVVHQGHIPVRKETQVYAEWVNEKLFDIVEALRAQKEESLMDIRNSHLSCAHSIAVAELSSGSTPAETPIVSVNTPYLTKLADDATTFNRSSFEAVCAMARKTARHRGITETIF